MIVIRKIVGVATLQDLGRVGFASQAIPRGGALVRGSLRRANVAVGNAPGAACIEIFGRMTLEATADITLATERGDRSPLRAGASLTIEPDASTRVRYLAIAGGFDAPLVFGSRSTFALCGIGRALRSGDTLKSANEHASTAWPPPSSQPSRTIRLIAGPDARECFDALATSSWKIAPSSDRTGTRLDGAPLASTTTDTLHSSPTVVGMIQLPAGGAPIVIGPDGPTTGGYAIVAVIVRADLDAFHATALGAPVRFARVDAVLC